MQVRLLDDVWTDSTLDSNNEGEVVYRIIWAISPPMIEPHFYVQSPPSNGLSYAIGVVS